MFLSGTLVIILMTKKIMMITPTFPKGVVHRVENGWGLNKVAAVLLNGLSVFPIFVCEADLYILMLYVSQSVSQSVYLSLKH